MNFHKALPPDLYQQVIARYPYRFERRASAPPGHVLIDDGWSLRLHQSCGRKARRAAADLRDFFRHTFGVRLRDVPTGRGIRVTIGEFAPVVPEAYERFVTRGGIDIVAHDDEGAMRALFHLQRKLLLARAPVLKCKNESVRPRWTWRVNYPLVHPPMDWPSDWLDYPDAYLLNMARHGYNATYLYLDLFDYVAPGVEPLLAPPGYRQRIRDLNHVIERLDGFGIRTLIHLNTLALPREHRLFRKHREMRGARSWLGGDLHCLCSSSNRVLRLYERVSRQLFSDAPGLAGAVLLVGGECFLHCYSRPNPRTEHGTNCPRCRRRPVAGVVSKVVNAVTRGANAARPEAQIFCWQYSAFVWGDDQAQARVVKALDPRVALLETFEKDDWITINGTKSYVFDYSISQLGPAPRFTRLARAARQRGMKVLARTEASQNIELFITQRLPIMHRWAERARRLRAANVDGVHSSWRFYGFCGQITDELLDYFAWAAKPDGHALLRQLAARDFGPAAAPRVVRAWKALSDAFGHFPYSGGITGFPYFRGPFFIGPAQPMIFDLTAPLNLPDAFYTADPSLGEGFKDAESQARKRPNFFLDLVWTQPFGAKKIRKPLEDLDQQWHRGVQLLESTLKRASGAELDRLQHELDLATFVGCCIRTSVNLLTVQQLYQLVTVEPCTPSQLRDVCLRAIQIVANEMDNASVALAISRRRPSIGFGGTYGRACGPEMIEAKIDHCKDLIEHGIPNFYEIYAFHIFGSTKPLRRS